MVSLAVFLARRRINRLDYSELPKLRIDFTFPIKLKRQESIENETLPQLQSHLYG